MCRWNLAPRIAYILNFVQLASYSAMPVQPHDVTSCDGQHIICIAKRSTSSMTKNSFRGLGIACELSNFCSLQNHCKSMRVKIICQL